MSDKPQYRRCEIKGCPMLLRVPAVVCHDHRREMAGEWAAGQVAIDRAKGVGEIPGLTDTKGESGTVAPVSPRAETSFWRTP